MESWSSLLGRKGLVSTEAVSDSDSYGRSTDDFVSQKSLCEFSNRATTPAGNNARDYGVQDFVEDELVHHSFADISGKGESFSKLSSFVMESNNHSGDLSNSLKFGGVGVLSSSDSSRRPRRARISSLDSSQTAYCQVYGCSLDLSSSKEYHKRHKVCDVHSKTAKVIVNGMEQRFCQQCSRFHMLGEFDNGKRSCRKRLAGHNRRRRKPQIGYAGSFLEGTCTTSFTGQEFLSAAYLLNPQTDPLFCKPVKLENRPTIPMDIQKLLPQPLVWTHESKHPFRNIRETDEGLCISSPETGFLSQNFDIPNAGLAVVGLSGISGFAPSLLSSNSQYSSSIEGFSCPSSYYRGYLGSKINIADGIREDSDSMIDLVRLSSQLQRVEMQRQSFQQNMNIESCMDPPLA